MREVRARFSPEEVAAYAVSTTDTEESIEKWIEDTALRVPVIIDSPADPSCWEMPGAEMKLYDHFINRAQSDTPLGPFPFQVIFAADGSLAYMTREHHPEKVVEVLEELVSEGGVSRAAAPGEAPP